LKVKPLLFSTAGAYPIFRDAIDDRLVSEIKSGKGRHPFCVERNFLKAQGDKDMDFLYEKGEMPHLMTRFDKFNGPMNPHGDHDLDGYSNIEEVLHRMSVDVEQKNRHPYLCF
jgi:hypothetical protein